MDQVKIIGARELHEALSTKIPRRMEGKILQKALAAGAAPILKAARRYATAGGDDFPDVITGTLRRAIFSARSKFDQSTTKEVRVVGVRKGKKAARKGRDAWYARLVEYGHKARDGSMVKPQPFLRPAYEQNQEAALQAILTKLRQLVDQAVAASRWK